MSEIAQRRENFPLLVSQLRAAVSTVQTRSIALRVFVLRFHVLRTRVFLILTMQLFRKLVLFLLRLSELYVPYAVLELDKVQVCEETFEKLVWVRVRSHPCYFLSSLKKWNNHQPNGVMNQKISPWNRCPAPVSRNVP